MAGAAYGLDHVMAHDILRTVKSVNGLVIGIILKPFSFEGRRRQREVGYFVTNFTYSFYCEEVLERIEVFFI